MLNERLVSKDKTSESEARARHQANEGVREGMHDFCDTCYLKDLILLYAYSALGLNIDLCSYLARTRISNFR
jgi:hypothetical protein